VNLLKLQKLQERKDKELIYWLKMVISGKTLAQGTESEMKKGFLYFARTLTRYYLFDR
jgi:hypothetical protein